VDVISGELPRDGERLHCAVAMRAGGSAANAAVWATKLGADATVVGRVGRDPAGELVAAGLEARGIEARLARDAEAPTGIAVALGAETSVAFPAASARLGPDDVPDPLEGDALLVSGFSLFQTGSAAGARAALERFRGQWAAVDIASPRLAASAGSMAGANVVLATAEEALALTGFTPDDAVRALGERVAVACVKLGEHGAVAAQGGDLVRVGVDPVERQSRFGAGDAFAAALLVALGGGEPLVRALGLACEAGARAAASDDGWPQDPREPGARST
jgi:sugar/nucleoside kinase (ribokinase family)